MAKKKTNYMSEKRFSLNDLIVGGCLLFGVFFFAVCLYAIDLYTTKPDDNGLINFSKGTNGIREEDILTFYEDKVSEMASYLQYGDELYYSVVDINNDDVKDLILKTGNQNGMEYKFYTFDAESFDNSLESLVYAGSIGADKGSLYKKSGDDFVTFHGDVSYYVYLTDNLISTFQVSITESLSRDNEIVMHDYRDLRFFE